MKKQNFLNSTGYYTLPRIDITKIPVTDFPLYDNWSYDRIYRTSMIKQPDVLMFLFLYNQSFSSEVKRANYEFYEPKTIHESSLSPSIHSIFAIKNTRKILRKLDFQQFFRILITNAAFVSIANGEIIEEVGGFYHVGIGSID